jgi:DNA-binding XRE family transcriptional regulator
MRQLLVCYAIELTVQVFADGAWRDTWSSRREEPSSQQSEYSPEGMRIDMKEMTLEERKAYIHAVADEVARGKLTLGGAVKRLRENLLGVSQERFALASKISKRALSQLEVDRGNPTLATLEAVFKKFGLQIALAHLNPADLNAAAAKKSNVGFGIPTATPTRPLLPSPGKQT